MATINISLPDKLKSKAEALVTQGHYASFSDIVRTALRDLIAAVKYDRLIKKTMERYKSGKATVLKTDKDIKEYFKRLS